MAILLLVSFFLSVFEYDFSKFPNSSISLYLKMEPFVESTRVDAPTLSEIITLHPANSASLTTAPNGSYLLGSTNVSAIQNQE